MTDLRWLRKANNHAMVRLVAPQTGDERQWHFHHYMLRYALRGNLATAQEFDSVLAEAGAELASSTAQCQVPFYLAYGQRAA
jgi:hypothetical protein